VIHLELKLNNVIFCFLSSARRVGCSAAFARDACGLIFKGANACQFGSASNQEQRERKEANVHKKKTGWTVTTELCVKANTPISAHAISNAHFIAYAKRRCRLVAASP
jgi:hypothetical protein